MAERYFDYLAECILMIGSEENRGLTLSPSSNKVNNTLNSIDDLTIVNFQQQILALISSNLAVFPFASIKPKYPLECFNYHNPNKQSKSKPKRQISGNNSEMSTIQEIVTNFNKTTDEFDTIKDNESFVTIDRRASRYMSRRKSVRDLNIDALSGKLGSVSLDTIKTFPGTYFNNNLQVSLEEKQPEIKILPMTDHLGNRSYAMRLEFHRIFYIESNFNEKPTSNLKIKQISTNSNDIKLYIPVNIVVISKYQYFDLIKSILSNFYNQYKSNDIYNALVELSSVLFRIPIIENEILSVTFNMFTPKHQYTIPSVDNTFKQIIDWNIWHIFDVLSIENIITILVAMFQEQKIVFLSNNSNLTTIICESLFLLFKPFSWKHFYMSDLPPHLFELLDAIFPYMLGVPKKALNLLNSYNDIIVVDLVLGTIDIRDECTIKMVNMDFIDNIKHDLNKINNKRYETLTNLDFENISMQRKYNNEINKEICEMTMESFTMNFLVDVFMDILQNISIEKKDNHIIFNADRFLNSSSKNVEFFKLIHRTHHFNCFIDDIFNKNIENGWVKLCKQKYPGELEHMIDKRKSLHDNSLLHKMSFGKEELMEEMIELPLDNETRNKYYSNLLEQIMSIKTESIRLLLLAEYQLQCLDKIKALEIFYNILKINTNLLNHKRLRKIIRSLNDKELISFRSKLFNHELCQLVNYAEKRPSEIIERPPNVEQFDPPTVPIPKHQFYSVCKEAKIAEYTKTVDNLLICLTMGQKSTKNREIPVDIFRCFYHYWIQSGDLPVDLKIENEFLDEEIIKFTENSIRIDNCGQGRVILTQYRLLFVPFGSKTVIPIIDFNKDKINKIKLDRKLRSFGKLTEVVEITKNNEKMSIWYREYSEIWYYLITEIYEANCLSKYEKDIYVLDQLTEHCNIIENLIVCSHIKSYFKKHLNDMIKTMIIYSNYPQHTDIYKNEHRKYLIRKLMPAPKLTPLTIDCIIIIPNEYSKNIFYFWCACYCNDKYFIRIITFNKNENKYDNKIIPEIELYTRIKSMNYMKEYNKIIGFGYDNYLYVYDVNEKLKENEILIDSTKDNYVLCSLLYNTTLYCGSVLGHLYQWNFGQDKVDQVLLVPNNVQLINFIHYKDTLFVAASVYRIHLIDVSQKSIVVDCEVSSLAQIVNRIFSIQLIGENELGVCFSRLPVVYIYQLNGREQPNLLMKLNLLTMKEYVAREASEHFELSPQYIGIATIIPVLIQGKTVKNDLGISSTSSTSSKFYSKQTKSLTLPQSFIEQFKSTLVWWVVFKNGTITIIDPLSINMINQFSVHRGSVDIALSINNDDSQDNVVTDNGFIVTVGREDGKINIWRPFKYVE